MRYNSERLDIKVLSSGNGLLFKDIKISFNIRGNIFFTGKKTFVWKLPEKTR